jgi:hypothetical protein
MRTLALAAVCGVGLLAGGVAAAAPFNDPAGRVTFEAPSGWNIRPQRAAGEQTVVLAFNPSSDCYVFGAANPATANATANATRNTTAALTADAWARAAAPVLDFFPAGQNAEVVSQSVDTSGFWPVQRAELRSGSRTVYAVVEARPGIELRAFCSGAASASAYDGIFNSLGHPNDATWQAQAGEQAAARQATLDANAAAEAANAAAAAAQQQGTPSSEGEQQRRRNRDPSRDH